MSAEISIARTQHAPYLSQEIADNVRAHMDGDKEQIICIESPNITPSRRDWYENNFYPNILDPSYNLTSRDRSMLAGNALALATYMLRDTNPEVFCIDQDNSNLPETVRFQEANKAIKANLPHMPNDQLLDVYTEATLARADYIDLRDRVMAEQLADFALDPQFDGTQITALVGAHHDGIANYLEERGVTCNTFIASGKDFLGSMDANKTTTNPQRFMASDTLNHLAFPTPPQTAAEQFGRFSSANWTLSAYEDGPAFDQIVDDLGQMRVIAHEHPEFAPIAAHVTQSFMGRTAIQQITEFVSRQPVLL